ncbi:MAG: hypothetical protein ACI38Q_00565 [Candidatus Bruticola sp.]
MKYRNCLRNIIFVVLTAILLISASVYAESMKLYKNNRFQFSFNYPESFIALEEPVNGDGQSFYSQLCQMKITGSGSYNVFNVSALEAASMYVPKGICWEKMANQVQDDERDVSLKWQDTNNCCFVRVLKIKEALPDDTERLLIIKVEFPRDKVDSCYAYAQSVVGSLRDTGTH